MSFITGAISSKLGVLPVDVATIGGAIPLVFVGIFVGAALQRPVRSRSRGYSRGRGEYHGHRTCSQRTQVHSRSNRIPYDPGYDAYLKRNAGKRYYYNTNRYYKKPYYRAR